MRERWAAQIAKRAELEAERALAYAVDDYWLADQIEEQMAALWHPKWRSAEWYAGFRRRHAIELGGN